MTSPGAGTAPAAVLGGTGFLGRAVVARLRAAGVPVRVAARHPGPAEPDGVEPVAADVRDPGAVAAAVAGCGAVVNAVALYVESGAERFADVHVEGAANVARAAAESGVRRLVHVSGIGASPDSGSAYVRARAAGEARVRELFPAATILRPSVLFGPGDAFLAAIDQLTALAPGVFPLFGAGRSRLQPVHVGDVAAAVVQAACSDSDAAGGRTLELGGPRVLTYREVVEAVLAWRGRRRLLVPVPFPIWEAGAAAASCLPSPPLTRDQLALLRAENVVDPERDGFAAFGLTPRDLETLLPECLGPR